MSAPILKQIDNACRMYVYVYVYWSWDKSKIREISLQGKRCLFRSLQTYDVRFPKGGRVFIACLENFPAACLFVHCLRQSKFVVMFSL